LKCKFLAVKFPEPYDGVLVNGVDKKENFKAPPLEDLKEWRVVDCS
jgi:hypothetical protein